MEDILLELEFLMERHLLVVEEVPVRQELLVLPVVVVVMAEMDHQSQ